MRGKLTEAEVFIIESLDPDDEGNGRFEGSIISQILQLHEKKSKYRYVRTKAQFKKAVLEFGKSNYRYLHISAHADSDGMCTTNRDNIDYDELAAILSKHLHGKRLFLSACSMVHHKLASEISHESGCLSIAGPKNDIKFSDAAILWSSFYHLMFSGNKNNMKSAEMKIHLNNISHLFNVNILCFLKTKSGYIQKSFPENSIR